MSHLSRITALALFVVSIMAYNIAPAMAESAVQDNPKTNVFLRYGADPVLEDNGYTLTTQIFNSETNVFDNTKSHAYGYLKLGVHTPRVVLVKHKGETIIGSEVLYQLSNKKGRLIEKYRHTTWTGKHPLPIYRRFGKVTALLVFVNVGLHSPKLPSQPAQPTQGTMA